MELVYRVTQLRFSDLGHFTHPTATVRVMPADAPFSSAACIDLTIRAHPAHAGRASPAQAAADAALQAAQELLNAEAVRRHLAALLAAEAPG